MKNKLLIITAIVIIYGITCVFAATGSHFSGLDLQPGDVASTQIRAIGSIENRIATERNRNEAELRALEAAPTRTLDYTITEQVMHDVNEFIAEINTIRNNFKIEQELKREEERREEERREAERREAISPDENGLDLSQAAGTIFPWQPETTEEDLLQTEDGVLSDGYGDDGQNAGDGDLEDPLFTDGAGPYEDGFEEYMAYDMFDSLSIPFGYNQRVYLMTMGDEAFNDFRREVDVITYDILHDEQGVSEIDGRTFNYIERRFSRSGLSMEEQVMGNEIVTWYLQPNYLINDELTGRNREHIANDYEVVMVSINNVIVDENEIITEEAYDIMFRLGMLTHGFIDEIIPLSGVFILLGALLASCVLYLSYYHKKTPSQKKEIILLMVLYIVVLGIVSLLQGVAYPFMPMLVFAMLVSMLIDTRVAILSTIFIVVAGYFTSTPSLEFLLFFTTSGILMCLMAKQTTDRNKIFMVGIYAALVNFILSCAISLITETNNLINVWPQVLATAGFTAANGMLTVIFCMGSLPFWERFFGVVTPIKLLDLTNPTNALIRRLTIEAPGTYHHSLIVANLAETAAFDIGANPHMARVGGYYHDIGKLKEPQYFVENISGDNPHDSMEPHESVKVLINHIEYGLMLAKEYKLPQFIRGIINEHHGMTLMQYFYHKAVKDEPINNIDENDFRYPYSYPQTRESACIMLADSVEAAVRSMVPRVKSVDEIEDQIDNIIRQKLNDSQLADSQLSIKDLDTISQSFFRVLKGMYHERISYPTATPKTSEILHITPAEASGKL